MRKQNINYELLENIRIYEQNGINILDAIVEIADVNNLDIEEIADQLDDESIEKLKEIYVKRHMIRNDNLIKDVDLRINVENILNWLK